MRQMWILLGALACLSLSATTVYAGAPKQSTSIDTATFATISYKDNVSADGYTSYLGIDECRDAVRVDDPLTPKFTTTGLDLSGVDISGDAYFLGAFIYSVARDATSGSVCTQTTTTCSQISDADYTITTKTIELDVSFQELTGLTSEDDCDAGEIDNEYFVQITFSNDSTSTTTQIGELRMIVDTKRPSAPTAFEGLATESAIQVSWTDDSPADDRSGYGVFYSTTAFEGGQAPSDVSGLLFAGNITVSTDEKVSGEVTRSLPANTDIYIALATRDLAGNYSVLTEPKLVTVLDTIDFWEAYKNSAGGEEGGYCTSAAPVRHATGFSLLGSLGVLGLWWRRRRR